MGDLVKQGISGAIIGAAAYGVNLVIGSSLGFLGAFSMIGVVALGFVLVNMIGISKQ